MSNFLEMRRNFCIIAHIDHGKSTLADQLIIATESVDKRKMRDLYLDNLSVERRHGITVKSQTINMVYKKDNTDYSLCLLDTPGHVDFSTEVWNSLNVVEGALLLIDATQGVQAQTLANVELAKQKKVKLIPIINKIDRDSADIERVEKELKTILPDEIDSALRVSAKKGIGIKDVLDAIVERVPHPEIQKINSKVYAVIFNSFIKKSVGSIIHIRVYKGSIKKNDELKILNNETVVKVLETGFIEGEYKKTDELKAGEMGYIYVRQKDIKLVRAGFLLTDRQAVDLEIPEVPEIQPMLVATLYPINSDDIDALEKAIESLAFNDSALSIKKEYSDYLGVGFRCGFLGSLHFTITVERLKDEFDIDISPSLPSVTYKVLGKDMSMQYIDRAYDIPSSFSKIYEPVANAIVVFPIEYVSPVLELIRRRRGRVENIELLGDKSYKLMTTMPLMEIIVAFSESLKTISKGYASLYYTMGDYEEGDLVKLTVLINNNEIKALDSVAPSAEAFRRAKHIAEQLQKNLSRRQYDLIIQVAANKRIIARETVKRYRKDVTQKLYGGDITRKMKLLEKQKKGKAKLGSITKDLNISTSTLMNILNFEKDM